MAPPASRPAQRVTARAARISTVVRAMARETDPKKRIVITGMGLCSVFGNDYDVFYDKLLAGTSGVAEIDRFDIEEFPTKFAAQIRDFDNEGFVDKKNARRMDDCLQYALVSGNKALLDAGLDEEALGKEDLTKIGVLAGSGMGGLTVFQDGVKALVNKGPKKIRRFSSPTPSPTWAARYWPSRRASWAPTIPSPRRARPRTTRSTPRRTTSRRARRT